MTEVIYHYYYLLSNRIEKNFFVKNIEVVNLTTYKLRLIAGKRGIKNYKNLSREKLLNTLDESERNFNTLSEKRLERVEKMQNLSQNKLQQVRKMQSQS